MSSPGSDSSVPIIGVKVATPGEALSLTDALGLVAQGFLLGHITNPELDIQQLEQVLK